MSEAPATRGVRRGAQRLGVVFLAAALLLGAYASLADAEGSSGPVRRTNALFTIAADGHGFVAASSGQLLQRVLDSAQAPVAIRHRLRLVLPTTAIALLLVHFSALLWAPAHHDTSTRDPPVLRLT